MIGIGIDIVNNKRIEKSLTVDFINKILTNNELKVYNKKKKKNKLHYICGRFALKEAIIKAISDYDNPNMKEIETYNKTNGKPYALYKNYNFLVSISHENEYTIAEVIALN